MARTDAELDAVYDSFVAVFAGPPALDADQTNARMDRYQTELDRLHAELDQERTDFPAATGPHLVRQGGIAVQIEDMEFALGAGRDHLDAIGAARVVAPAITSPGGGTPDKDKKGLLGKIWEHLSRPHKNPDGSDRDTFWSSIAKAHADKENEPPNPAKIKAGTWLGGHRKGAAVIGALAAGVVALAFKDSAHNPFANDNGAPTTTTAPLQAGQASGDVANGGGRTFPTTIVITPSVPGAAATPTTVLSGGSTGTTVASDGSTTTVAGGSETPTPAANIPAAANTPEIELTCVLQPDGTGEPVPDNIQPNNAKQPTNDELSGINPVCDPTQPGYIAVSNSGHTYEVHQSR